MAAPDPTERDPAVPSSIASPRGKLVYLYLDGAGRATAEEIAGDLGMARLAVYGVLREYRRRDLVRRTDGGYRLG